MPPDDSSPPPAKRPRPSFPPTAPAAPVDLSQVNTKALDFDLRPICSVTLKTHNIYICLSCGRYLHGRHPATPAHTHALETGHALCLNHATEAVYALPDDVRVTHPSLDPVTSVLRPKYTRTVVDALDTQPVTTPRIRGAVALQKLHPTDYANAAVQLFLRPPRVRDHLLLSPADSPLQAALSELCRKLWASHAFRDHVSPHHLMHLLAETPRFGLLRRGDPVDLLAHLFNQLHVRKRVGGAIQRFSDVLTACFRGVMRVDDALQQREDPRSGEEDAEQDGQRKSSKTHFWFLPLDLPPKPLFKDATERTLVPQVPLEHLLRKYDGVTTQHVVKTGAQRTHALLRLPEFLILVIRRFTKSKFGTQKNPTVVHLPPVLDLSGLCEGDNNYVLIAAVLHEGTPEGGDYSVALRHDATGNWYELKDTKVSGTQFQLVSLADTYILLYERVKEENNVA